jgi:hypothetical protein
MEPKKVQMAEDIVQGYVQKELEKSPKLREKVRKNPKKLKEVREQVISTHSKKKT